MKKIIPLFLFCVPVLTNAQITPICDIQGDGSASPVNGSTVNTTGIVTSVFNNPDQLDGFFLEAPDCDGDESTSDGIFVYDPGGTPVEPGDSITLTADVSEFFGLTELSNVSGLTVVASSTLIPLTDLQLPVNDVSDLEAYEGMNVRFLQELTATDHFNWARFGEVVFSSGGRLVQPSNIVDLNDDPPSGTTSTGNSNLSSLLDLEDMNDRNRILVDDASSDQYSDPPPWLDAQGTFRAGSTVMGLEGALSYSFGNFRLQPTSVETVVNQPRPDPPFEGTTDLQVVSFNVLNYWTTIGGWGSQTVSEFNRQQNKVVAALIEMNADVYGLMELENNNAEAYEDLLEALNEEAGSGTYAALDAAEPGLYPTKSVMFYKPSTVTPVGALRSLNDPIFERPTLSQIFETNDGGGKFNYVLNHLRFKGCDGATGLDLDQDDGQACFNETRRQQAMAVLNFIDTIKLSTGVDQILIGGDFNAYAQEDPMDIIEGGGYNRMLPLDAYTFSFFGQWGALDHAFASDEMVPAITGTGIWHVNSDEPRGLGWEDVSSYLYQSNAYRSSDHDPVCITIDKDLLITSVEGFETNFPLKVYPNPFDEAISFEYELTENAHVRIELYNVLGELLHVPFDGFKHSGIQSLDWTCKGIHGQFVIYKISVTANDGHTQTSSGKLMTTN